jgi:hypothetical protein
VSACGPNFVATVDANQARADKDVRLIKVGEPEMAEHLALSYDL